MGDGGEEVRRELALADVVMPSLDATDEGTFRRINRPYRRLHIEEIIESKTSFREIFKGQLWVEVMLVRGLNDQEEVLVGIRDALRRIHPDRVYLNAPIRPPAERWVEIPDEEGLGRAHSILGNTTSIVYHEEGEFGLEGFENPLEAILMIVQRHPMREEQIVETLAPFSQGAIRDALDELENSDRVRQIPYEGKVFYTYIKGRYAERERSR